MTIEAALIKPVVDVLLALFQQGSELKLKHNAQASVREAIRELLQANPDENRAAARIAIARAAGILSEDVVLAEDMLQKHRASRARTRGKSTTGRRRTRSEPVDPGADTAAPPGDATPRTPTSH
ncbi:hypothetical protein CNR27_02970 [Luteimonas chenhongjianii]|uniref:Uncharacterized protein n=1 Tax=Luteimonas chenhongjianii TaxID=2006110 RepID=A0A290XBT7_9GAMM|nr:hypothetical protein [Luteimonas chenhongjianii]ATD66543.1 hypothetical protein CNR27_02970 [Luteimonas chenhongjianii]